MSFRIGKVKIIIMMAFLLTMYGCSGEKDDHDGKAEPLSEAVEVNEETQENDQTIGEVADNGTQPEGYTRYDFSPLAGSVLLPDDYVAYSNYLPFLEEKCIEQGIDPENMKSALGTIFDDAMLVPADEKYEDASMKIFIKVKEKKYGDITLSELSPDEYELTAATIVSSFGEDDYETVEENGLKYFVFHTDATVENQCRFATILNGHMVYIYAATGNNEITEQQYTVLKNIATNIEYGL